MEIPSTAYVLLVAVLVAVISVATEYVTWFLVYRAAAYRKLIQTIEKSAKEHQTIKQGSKLDVKGDKNKRAYEKNVKSFTQAIWSYKMKAMILQGVLLVGAWWIMSSKFAGFPLGRLPFDVPPFMHRMTHAKLKGEDYREVSFTFIYMMCQMGVRQNLVKLCNVGPSRWVSSMTEMNQLMPTAAKVL